MVVCIYCSGLKVIKFGSRETKQRGKIQRYSCKNCNRTFCIDDGFKHRHKSEKTILDTLLLLPKMSLRELSDFMDLSKNTPLAWLNAYSGKLLKYLKDKVQTQCNTLHMDELFLKMRGNFHYVWDSICKDTRFAFWFLAPWRTGKYAKELMKISAYPDERLVTDGSFSYIRPVKERYGLRFYYRNYHRCESFEDKKHNNLIERLQNTLRRYLHHKRGFYDCKTGNVFMAFLWIYYNFVRNHMAIGCTPAEKAGLICFFGLKREYERLLKLIELSFFAFISQNLRLFLRLFGAWFNWFPAHQP
jgi:transposase-like protein